MNAAIASVPNVVIIIIITSCDKFQETLSPAVGTPILRICLHSLFTILNGFFIEYFESFKQAILTERIIAPANWLATVEIATPLTPKIGIPNQPYKARAFPTIFKEFAIAFTTIASFVCP